MADSDRWTITKLDGEDNWSTWKFQVKHFMLAKGLWKYVEGTVFESGASDTEMQRAFSYLVMSIAPSQLYLITTCDSPQEAWKILTSHFDRNTLANKLFLKKQYFRCEMREGESVVNQRAASQKSQPAHHTYVHCKDHVLANKCVLPCPRLPAIACGHRKSEFGPPHARVTLTHGRL